MITFSSPWHVTANKKESLIKSLEQDKNQWAYTAARQFQAGIYSNKNSEVQEQRAQESCRAAAPGDLSR